MTQPATITDDMITAAQGGDSDAMWQIVSAHEGLFIGLIRQVAPKAKPDQAEDLLQEARAVLVERVRMYDSCASSASLQTYVYRTVRRAVAEAWVAMTTGLSVDPTIVLRVRRALVDAGGNIELAWLELNSRHGYERGTFLAAVDALTDVDSLDAPQDGEDGEGLTLADVIADPTTDVTDPTERRELAAWLLYQIESRQSYALRSYYGVGMEQAEDTAVAFHLRVTPANVRKLRSRGIDAARVVAARHDLAA